MVPFRKVPLLLAVAAAVWAGLLVWVPEARQERLFFCDAQVRHFFDYFNPRSILTAERPYAAPGTSPAIGTVDRQDQCYAALAVHLSGLFPETIGGALACQAFGVAVYLFGFALILRKYGVPVILPTATLLVSGPFLFSVEVGNQILYAAGLALVFLAWYDSDRRSRRVWAVLALAVAAVLKLTPALLGLAYLCSPRQRDWRGAILAGLVFSVLLTVPFVFLGGTDAFVAWLENAQANSQVYAVRNGFGPYGLVAEFAQVVGFRWELLSLIHTPLRLVSSLFAIVLLVRAFLVAKDEFRRLCLIVLGMLFLPPTMMCYTVLYLVPFLVIGTFRCAGASVRTFAIAWIACCLPLQVPLLLGSANACMAVSALLDLSILLFRRKAL